MDTRRRSIAKSLTWRIAGVVILGAISYAFTRDLAATTGITLLFHGIRLVMYYWHERLWERVEWGRIRHPLSHYVVRPDLSEEDHKIIRQFLQEREFTVADTDYEI